MKRLTAFLVLAALALAWPALAAAKGPASATVTGPGLDGPIHLSGVGDSGSAGTLGRVVEHGGFFSAITQDGRLAAKRTAGDLGPRYTVVYSMSVDGTEQVRQTVYPYAEPLPVTYIAAGQNVYGRMKTHGGWYVGDERLRTALVEAGLPPTPPAAVAGVERRRALAPAPSAADDGLELRQPLVLAPAFAAAFALAAAAALLLRRRRPATAR